MNFIRLNSVMPINWDHFFLLCSFTADYQLLWREENWCSNLLRALQDLWNGAFKQTQLKKVSWAKKTLLFIVSSTLYSGILLQKSITLQLSTFSPNTKIIYFFKISFHLVTKLSAWRKLIMTDKTIQRDLFCSLYYHTLRFLSITQLDAVMLMH